MIGRLINNKEKRTNIYVSCGTVHCGLCNRRLPSGSRYTRHQTTIYPWYNQLQPKLMTYCLCNDCAPFREETEEEREQATGPMYKIIAPKLKKAPSMYEALTVKVPALKKTRLRSA